MEVKQNTFLKIMAGIIIVIAMFSGVTLKWVFEKEYTTLYSNNTILARSSWFIEAERTYINKDSWYDINVKCPKIFEMGGHETATRCYYPDQYYEQMSRSLLGSDISYSNNSDNYIVTKETPSYQYGTRGSYAGVLEENMLFEKTTSTEEDFPMTYNVSWSPRDTRNYKLVWRVENLKEIDLYNGNYTKCFYQFGKIKIDLADGCDNLDYAEVKDGNKIWFYFNPERGEQVIHPRLYDPDILTSYDDENIVKSSEIKWENPLRACVYRNYSNPTDYDYYSSLESVFEITKGTVLDKGVEIKVPYTDKINITSQDCKEEYDKINDSYVTICKDKIEEKSVTKYNWIIPKDFKFEPKESYELRQCVERNAVLDEFEVEVHTPFLGYSLKEYTTISSSGYNLSTLDRSDQEAYWTHDDDEVSGSTSLDLTSNNNDGTIDGATTGVTGQINEAFDFDGSNDYIKNTDSLIPSPTAFSVSQWFYIDASAYKYERIFEARKDIEFIITVDDGTNSVNSPGLMVRSDQGGWGTRLDYPVSVGQWYHFVVTWDNTNGYIFYLDGSQIGTDGTTTSFSSGTQNNFIGGIDYASGPDFHFNGKIDEVGVWSRAVSGTEVGEVYDEQKQGFTGQYPYDIYGNLSVNTGSFNKVLFEYTERAGQTCDDTDVNISANDITNFEGLSGTNEHIFSEQVEGFNLSINNIDCEYVWMNISNSSGLVITDLSPDDGYNDTDDSNITFGGVIYTENDVSSLFTTKLYINGTEEDDGLTNLNNSNYTFTESFDHPYELTWIMQACDEEECVNSSSRTAYIYDWYPNATNESPLNNEVINASSFDFTCYLDDDYDVVNMSVYVNDTYNTSKTVSSLGNNTIQVTTNTFGNGSFEWVCQVEDDIGQLDNSSSSIFNISYTPSQSTYECMYVNNTNDWTGYDNISLSYYGNTTNTDCNLFIEISDDDGTSFRSDSISTTTEEWKTYTYDITTISGFDLSNSNKSYVCLNYSMSSECSVFVDDLHLINTTEVTVDYAAGCNSTHYVRLSNSSDTYTKLCEVDSLESVDIYLWANFYHTFSRGKDIGFTFRGSED